MFALSGPETAVLALWVVGVLAAVRASRHLDLAPGAGLLVGAVVLPVIGSLLALVVATTVLVGRWRGPALSHR